MLRKTQAAPLTTNAATLAAADQTIHNVQAQILQEIQGDAHLSSALNGVTRLSSKTADLITPAAGAGWTVADWLVANASLYGITQVSYAGYQWTASLTETSWQADSGATASGIVAS